MLKEKLKDEDRTRCSIYSRVMGYFQPTTLWNTGKKGEWNDRHTSFFKEQSSEELDVKIIPKVLKKLNGDK